MKSLAALALSVSCFSCCSTHTLDDARTAVVESMQRYDAALRGPVDGVVAMYTEDGELLLPGMAAIHGQRALHDFLAPLVSMGKVESVTTTVDDVEANGDHALLWGHYLQVASDPQGKRAEYKGRIVVEWQRGRDGAWRLKRTMVQPG